MNPNEIKKALEFCTNRTVSCVGCPFEKDNFCGRKILQGSLAYINQLEAEVERFKKRQKPTKTSGYKIENGKVVFFVNILNDYRYEYKDLEEVVKTLNELLKEAYSKDEIAFALKCKTEDLKTAKSEAVKEFAELTIKDICEQVNAPTPSESYIVEKCNQVIVNRLKEMVGDE